MAYMTESDWQAMVRELMAENDKLAAEVARLRAEFSDLVDQAELACAVIERVLDADASEGTPIWEWTNDEAETGVREVLAVAGQLMSALDRVHASATPEGA
jgi:hypothetical protein